MVLTTMAIHLGYVAINSVPQHKALFQLNLPTRSTIHNRVYNGLKTRGTKVSITYFFKVYALRVFETAAVARVN